MGIPPPKKKEGRLSGSFCSESIGQPWGGAISDFYRPVLKGPRPQWASEVGKRSSQQGHTSRRVGLVKAPRFNPALDRAHAQACRPLQQGRTLRRMGFDKAPSFNPALDRAHTQAMCVNPRGAVVVRASCAGLLLGGLVAVAAQPQRGQD
jgi:hypothetical protein